MVKSSIIDLYWNGVVGMRILYFGILGSLSRGPLAALLKAKLDVVGIVLPLDRVPPYQLVANGRFQSIEPILPTVLNKNLLGNRPPSLLEIASENNIPAFAVRDFNSEETINVLRQLGPDLICVSCFPHRLPLQLLTLPSVGCLNVHPSRLPQFRGPAPLFWTFQRGIRESGVTVHFMDEGFDTGDIVGQRPYFLKDGISEREAEQDLGRIGGDLLVEVVQQISLNKVDRQPQPDGYLADSWPADKDFELLLTWSARHAFNFMRGTAVWERPYFVNIDGKKIRLNRVISYQKQQKLGEPFKIEGNQISIQFSNGVLVCDYFVPNF